MERKEQEQGRDGTIAIILAVILLMLPVVYLLSTGPISWLDSHGYIAEGGFVWEFYAPIRWLNVNCPPFTMALDWYTSFFTG